MDNNDQNLISMMVEETMSSASADIVLYSAEKKCFKLNLRGFELEVPENWSALSTNHRGDIIIPDDFIQVLNTKLFCELKVVRIVKDFEDNLVLEVESFDNNDAFEPIAA